LIIGESEVANQLGKFGAARVVQVPYQGDFDAQIFTDIICKSAISQNSSIVILSHTADGKCLTGRIAVKMQCGLVSAACGLPEMRSRLCIPKMVFSGKAKAWYNILTEKAVISVSGNSIQPQIIGQDVTPEIVNLEIAETKIKVISRKTVEGIVPLPEAELVVSAGRGMKGPENWNIVEELANSLGATTACSRPVADTGWRPHHEHVGQTGVAIKPNLYIAIGISGAIQHLAGVNNSKTIVVINKDPEAPFFKAADYGIVGDLFEIVPKLTSAVNKFKQGH
jgi:electron transfer flavoprotein alpha subunit